jgi:hypothetical protein
MTLQERIKNDLNESIKARNKEKTNTLKLIYGELQRLEKTVTDEQAIIVLKKLLKYEEENLERSNLKESEYSLILKNYLPQQISEEDIKNWIINNIDFSQFKNKFESIRVIKENFPDSDGKIIKKIIEQL